MRGFFLAGFGIGLLFFLPLGLVENALYSAVVLLRGEGRNSIRALLFGTLFISIILTSIAMALIHGAKESFSEFSPWALTIFWAWYFALVPQLILRRILSKGHTMTLPNRRHKTILLRIVLTVVLPVGLYLVHGLLGNVIGIPSD